MESLKAYILNIFLFIGLFANQSLAQGFGDDPSLNDDLDIHPTDVIKFETVGAQLLNSTVTIGLRLTYVGGFSIYTDKLQFKPPSGFTISNITTPDKKTIIDPISTKSVSVYKPGEFIITYEGLEPYKNAVFPLDITFLGCTERICLFPYTQTMNIQAFPAKFKSSAPQLPQKQNKDIKSSVKEEESTANIERDWAEKLEKGKLTTSMLVVVLFLAGLLTNLTPCVFPMIPITLRILGNQGADPWLRSCQYSLGIIATYTLLGFIASLSGGLFGAMLGSATVNIVFALVFITLALTMLGFGNLSKLQSIGAQIGSGKKSGFNTFLMGAGAGLVAAPCTGPILGALIVYAANDLEPQKAFLLFLMYSAGFGLPYVFLGGAAGSVSKIKVPAMIQISVKMAFAAIMFGLSFYYLRIPLHQLTEALSGTWLITGISTGFAGLLSVVVITRFSPTNKIAAVLPTAILGFGLFALTQWASGGDFTQTNIKWLKTVESGVASARKSNKPIIIDGWAEWCEACKKMDRTTYQDIKVIKELKDHWVTVKLDFTILDEEAEKLAEKYQMQGLPVTLLLQANGRVNKDSKRLTGYISSKNLIEELEKYRGGGK